MKYAFAIFLAAAGALASMNDTLTTVIVTALTTYCPEATELTHNGVVYTITEETTLTITDCPCTLTKPLLMTPSTILYTSCTEYTPPPPPYPPASTPPTPPTTANLLTISYIKPTPSETEPVGGNVVVTGTGIGMVPSGPVMYTGAGGRKGVNGMGMLVVGVGMLVGWLGLVL